MKHFFPSYVRVPLLFVIFYFIVECSIDSGDQPAFVKYPIVLVLYGFFLLALITIEVLISTINNVFYRLLTPEQRAAQAAEDSSPKWYKGLMAVLTRSKSIEEEKDIMKDHEFDGIRELDNVLPPWWVWLFWGTIIFAVVYLVRFELLGAPNQHQEYGIEMAQAEKEIADYKLTAPDLVNADNVKFLTDASDIAAGKTIFEANCIACHMADGGGGIGPNLTDQYWILGGSIKDVFHTISEGGRDGKGMVAWKDQIKAADIEKVASYVLSLQGTTPANPKAPEGDLYAGETTTAVVTGTVIDTLASQQVTVNP